MTRKEAYLHAHKHGFAAFVADAECPNSHTNQGCDNRWNDYRDDNLLGTIAREHAAGDWQWLYRAFCDGYQDAQDRE